MMKSIWVMQMIFKPAGPMTFRRMPSGSLPIMSYPFMPPTTMSGFLQRILLAAEKALDDVDFCWPGYGADWFAKGKRGQKLPGQEYTLTLGKEYRPLGAFPEFGKWNIHKTRRHGPKNFAHKEFSKIVRDQRDAKRREDFQLHHWDYLFCDQLTGWIAAADQSSLERFSKCTNFGGKAGKEGYLWVAEVHKAQKLELRTGWYRPIGLVPSPLKPDAGTFYMLYGHHWNNDYVWTNGEKGGVDGYFKVGGWLWTSAMKGLYWALDDEYGFPAQVVDSFLRGDAELLFGDAS